MAGFYYSVRTLTHTGTSSVVLLLAFSMDGFRISVETADSGFSSFLGEISMGFDWISLNLAANCAYNS
jgi:hypothetical protein